MIVTGIFAMTTVAFLVITILAAVCDNEDMAVLGFVLTIIFLLATGIAGCVESYFGEERTACQTYCTEQGYSYDSVEWEGEEQYCICDTSLERHLIKKNIGVIIE